jgi:hypothetical protein
LRGSVKNQMFDMVTPGQNPGMNHNSPTARSRRQIPFAARPNYVEDEDEASHKSNGEDHAIDGDTSPLSLSTLEVATGRSIGLRGFSPACFVSWDISNL